MQKVKHFFFTFIPLLLTVAIQYLASFFSMGFSTLIESVWYVFSKSADIITIFDDLSYLWLTSRFNTYVMIIYAAMSIVVFGLWYYIRYDGNYKPDIHRTFHPLSLLGVVMLVPGMQYLSTYIISFSATLFPDWLTAYEELLESAGFDETLTIGMFLYSVIFAPLSEELIFRGVTMRQARRALPFWAANLMQAILFGAFHMNMIQGIYAFCLGLILGYICERGGSIYYAILLHMLFNFWGTVISQFVTIGESAFAVLFWFIFALVMTIGGIAVFTAGIKKLTPQNSHLQNATDVSADIAVSDRH